MSEKNTLRADRAELALNAYTHLNRFPETEGRTHSEDKEDYFGDLLVDLRHLADRLGIDFKARNKMAKLHYKDEKLE
jgi:hypothetical protein